MEWTTKKMYKFPGSPAPTLIRRIEGSVGDSVAIEVLFAFTSTEVPRHSASINDGIESSRSTNSVHVFVLIEACPASCLLLISQRSVNAGIAWNGIDYTRMPKSSNPQVPLLPL